jgi:DNA repair protein RadA/Sms
MGGGLTRGSTVLVGGEPGIGKSTLLVQALGSLAVGGVATLYVTAEESEVQVARRATRLGLADSGLALASTTSVEAICGAIAAVRPDVVVVDSIQTVHVEGAAGAAGSASQVRAATQQLIAHAKAAGATLVLVGHVTKDGSLAGPRQLEHIVDTVLTFDGDRYQNLRYLRAVKHRFGPTNEVGLLSMGEMGLDTVEDPSGTFLADRSRGLSGSAITCTLDGRRPLLAEIQALLVERAGASSRRAVQGLDSGRVELLLAVLHRRCGVPTANLDAFALAMAGARVLEPASDLAISMAVVSAITGRPLPHDAVLCGEVGLSGELRQVGDVPRRLSEAARLGFRRAVVPTGCGTSVPTMDVVEVNSLTEAILTLIPPEATGSASRSARGDC